MNEIMVRIRFQLPSLPRAEKVVAEALLENPEAIMNLHILPIWRVRQGVVTHRSFDFANEWGIMGIQISDRHFWLALLITMIHSRKRLIFRMICPQS